jgi:vacuolar-type H+-ATPase subunit C/Vma6
VTDRLFANAFMASHQAKFMLTKERIRMMLAATAPDSVKQTLAECDYDITYKTDDEIIDAERKKTFELFTELCDDSALSECIKAKYDFVTLKKEKHISYPRAEKLLYRLIGESLSGIKSSHIKEYFQTELDCFNNGHKIPDEPLFKVAYDGKNDPENNGPLFYWYILKQCEFKAVKAILMGKRLEFPREIITENLRGLYERFRQ